MRILNLYKTIDSNRHTTRQSQGETKKYVRRLGIRRIALSTVITETMALTRMMPLTKPVVILESGSHSWATEQQKQKRKKRKKLLAISDDGTNSSRASTHSVDIVMLAFHISEIVNRQPYLIQDDKEEKEEENEDDEFFADFEAVAKKSPTEEYARSQIVCME